MSQEQPSSKELLRTIAELKDLSIGLRAMHCLLQANIVNNAVKLLERHTDEPSVITDLLAYGYAPGNYTSHCIECDQNMDSVDKRCRVCKPCAERRRDRAVQPPSANPSDLVTALAHRAVGNQEQDLQNGKLAGYCIVCQVPWPCDTAKHFLRPVQPPSVPLFALDALRVVVQHLGMLATVDFKADSKFKLAEVAYYAAVDALVEAGDAPRTDSTVTKGIAP